MLSYFLTMTSEEWGVREQLGGDLAASQGHPNPLFTHKDS